MLEDDTKFKVDVIFREDGGRGRGWRELDKLYL